jgi:hypothetical protein
MNFCDRCNKIVPDSEIFDLAGLVVVKTHCYTKTENLYNNRGTGRIGYCPVKKTVWCGNVREPTDQEFFIYETLGIDDVED